MFEFWLSSLHTYFNVLFNTSYYVKVENENRSDCFISEHSVHSSDELSKWFVSYDSTINSVLGVLIFFHQHKACGCKYWINVLTAATTTDSVDIVFIIIIIIIINDCLLL